MKLFFLQNPAFQEEGGDVLKFRDFDLHDKLVNGLKEMGFKTPTNVQVGV